MLGTKSLKPAVERGVETIKKADASIRLCIALVTVTLVVALCTLTAVLAGARAASA